MRRAILCLAVAVPAVLIAALMSSCRGGRGASAVPDTRTEAFSSYHNSRFGFSVSYPSFLTPSATPENGDGLEFVCDSISLVTYGALLLHGSAEEFLAEEKEFFSERGDVLESVEKTDGGFVIRGRIPAEDLFFYEKAVLSLGAYGDRITCTAYLTYPESESSRAGEVISALESFPQGVSPMGES